MLYPDELGKKDLKMAFKPFISIQNKLLVDYRLFRDHILGIVDPEQLKQQPQ